MKKLQCTWGHNPFYYLPGTCPKCDYLLENLSEKEIKAVHREHSDASEQLAVRKLFRTLPLRLMMTLSEVNPKDYMSLENYCAALIAARELT